MAKGQTKTGNGIERVTVSLRPGIAKLAKIRAALNNVTVSLYVTGLLESDLPKGETPESYLQKVEKLKG